MCFRALLVSFYCCFGAIALVGQNSAYLISELKRELFPVQTEFKPLYSYISDSCPNSTHLIIDSSIYIRSAQPDCDRVLLLLEQIYWEHDTFLMPELLAVYQSQMGLFKKEFASAFLHNYRRCDAITEQFSILSAFEEILLSFELSRLSDKDVFDYFVNYTFLVDSFIRNAEPIQRKTILDQFPVYIEDYRNLKAKGWTAHDLPFHFTTYHKKRAQPYFIDYFEHYNWVESEWPVLIWRWNEYYLSIYDSRILKSLILNFKYLKERGIETFAYHYVHKYYDKELLELVFNDWLSLTYTNQRGSSTKDLYTRLLLTGECVDYIPKLLVKASISRPEVVNEQLKYFPAQYQLEKRLADYQGPRSEKVAARKLLKKLRKQQSK